VWRGLLKGIAALERRELTIAIEDLERRLGFSEWSLALDGRGRPSLHESFDLTLVLRVLAVRPL
jgi:hypothetical protein